MSNTASKKTLLIMLAVFVIPVVLAKIALENDWFNRGSTNKGSLLEPTINVSTLMEGEAPKWRMVYVLPSVCDATCENALFSINQVWLALGKESDRAEAVVLVNAQSDQSAVAALADYPFVEVKQLVSGIDNPLATQSVYIVDTLNNAMLFYTLDEDRQTAVMESRNMLADIKKLLKLSRIG